MHLDVINGEFDPAVDRIDLRLIDADETAPGEQAFVFIGTGPFTAAGQVSYAIEGSDTVMRMNTLDDLGADAVIRLARVHVLDAGNFLL